MKASYDGYKMPENLQEILKGPGKQRPSGGTGRYSVKEQSGNIYRLWFLIKE